MIRIMMTTREARQVHSLLHWAWWSHTLKHPDSEAWRNVGERIAYALKLEAPESYPAWEA